GAAVAVQVHAEQPQPPQVRRDALRERAGLEVLAHDRQEALAHVLAHGVADQPLLVVELGVQGERVAGVEGGKGGGGDGHALQRTTCSGCGSENAPLTRWPVSLGDGSVTLSSASPAVEVTFAAVDAK